MVILLAAMLVGCAVNRPTPRVPPPVGDSRPSPDASTESEREKATNPANHFVRKAREQFRNNRLAASEETINRGLNVAPEDPRLWHLLAKVRFLQERYRESETLAQRSLGYSNTNSDLIERNRQLIANARERRAGQSRKRNGGQDRGAEGSSWF